MAEASARNCAQPSQSETVAGGSGWSETCKRVEDEHGGKYRTQSKPDNPRCSSLVHACDITHFRRAVM